MRGALYPQGAIPQDLQVGTPVRWYIGEKNISPYVGRITHVVPATNKVWVAWPIGYPTQHDPGELIIVPPEEGISFVNTDFGGYDSYEKQLSEKNFGVMEPQVVAKLASRVAMRASAPEEKEVRRTRIASKVASSFSRDIIGLIKKAAEECKEAGMNDLKAYDALYGKFSSSVSDEVLKDAIFSAYE